MSSVRLNLLPDLRFAVRMLAKDRWFTPTDSSWLNQVELWFATIERDMIARGIFTSVADLRLAATASRMRRMTSSSAHSAALALIRSLVSTHR